jgi:restriction system protein
MSNKVIDTTNSSYEEWESLFFSKKYDHIFPNMCFPNEAIKEEYLRVIKTKSDLEIREILRKFLIKSTILGSDHQVLKYLLKLNNDELKTKIEKVEYFNRIVHLSKSVWEGLTWILDLLPNFPKLIQVLN